MAVLFVQLQAPDTGLYSIPCTDCTEKPSDRKMRRFGAVRVHRGEKQHKRLTSSF